MVSPTDYSASGNTRYGDEQDQTLGELLAKLSQDSADLLKTQVELTKAEVREEVREASRAGVAFGVAGLLGFLALLLLSFAAAWGLSEIVPEGVAFLIVGVVFAAIAAVAFLVGRKTVEQADFVPHDTIETVKEDVQWAKRQMS
jgi:uncharacterized membrane protein YqjE